MRTKGGEGEGEIETARQNNIAVNGVLNVAMHNASTRPYLPRAMCIILY